MSGPAPWTSSPLGRRQAIGVETVLDALAAAGQRGAAPSRAERGDPLSWWSPLLSDTGSAGARAAAVLVALFEEDGETRLVLTRRSAELRRYRGQVSFPGGGIEPGEHAVDAALREAEEEIGLDPTIVEVAGWLHPLFTFNGASLVLPVVGVLSARPALSPNPAEVARVFDVELAHLVGDGVFQEGEWDPYDEGSAGPSQTHQIWFFDVAGERIWGATARIIHELALLALGIDSLTR